MQTDQAFTWTLTNNGGVLQHSIHRQSGPAIPGNFAQRINNASAGATTTPTGTDAMTAMAGGGKIGSANTNAFWFDTADQAPANFSGSASIIDNSTGIPLTVQPQVVSINIKGATEYRLVFMFLVNGTAAAFPLNITDIPPGKSIQVQFSGKLR